jgi:hypothetical protein
VLSNQEWAVILWAGVALAFILCTPGLRCGPFRILRSFAHRKVLIAFVLTVAWATSEVALGYRLSLWTTENVADTVFWFLTSAVVMFVNLTGISTTEHFLRNIVRRLFTASAALAGFVYFFSLPLWAAIVLVPVEALLVGLSVVARHSKDQVRVASLADRLLWMIAIGLIVHGMLRLVLGWDTIEKVGLLRSLALPIWLMIGLIPIVYLLGLYAEFEAEFVRLKVAGYCSRFGWKYVFALASVFNLRAHALWESSNEVRDRLDDSMSISELRGLMRSIRDRYPTNHSNARRSSATNETTAGMVLGMTGPIGGAMKTVLSLALKQEEAPHSEPLP